jgi:hypothetical protein
MRYSVGIGFSRQVKRVSEGNITHTSRLSDVLCNITEIGSLCCAELESIEFRGVRAFYRSLCSGNWFLLGCEKQREISSSIWIKCRDCTVILWLLGTSHTRSAACSATLRFWAFLTNFTWYRHCCRRYKFHLVFTLTLSALNIICEIDTSLICFHDSS